MSEHNPLARRCIEIVGIPISELRDDISCPACDEIHTVMHLDLDVHEILARETWCPSCMDGDKPQLSQAQYDRLHPLRGNA